MTIIKTVSTSKNAKRTMAGRLNVLCKECASCLVLDKALHRSAEPFFIIRRYRCQQKCTNTEGSFYCSCHDGYKLNKNRCDDDDECVENNGNCSNICINLIGSHVCACEAGFMLGSDNVTCQDVDECQDLHDCSHICINTEGTYECSCPSGFVLGHDQFNCHDVDECLSSPCLEGHCVNTLGSFHCQCSPGYELFVEEKTCVDKNECLDTPCSHHCVNLPGR